MCICVCLKACVCICVLVQYKQSYIHMYIPNASVACKASNCIAVAGNISFFTFYLLCSDWRECCCNCCCCCCRRVAHKFNYNCCCDCCLALFVLRIYFCVRFSTLQHIIFIFISLRLFGVLHNFNNNRTLTFHAVKQEFIAK